MSCYIFAGGGTGGHLYPGLAVAQELVAMSPQARIVFACSNRAIDRKILDPLPYAVVPQPVRPIPLSLGGMAPFVRDYLRSARLARDMIADLKPVCVLGLGGFAAGPLVVRAAKSGVPTALLNPDAVPGKANRLLARHAEAIFTQFDSTRTSFARAAQGRVRCVGVPLRRGLALGGRQDALELWGLRGDRKNLLVFGGSLLAESISLALEAIAPDLAKLGDRWQVLHISGSPCADRIHHRLESAQVPVKTLSYCDRMDLAYAAADLALARAGAGTVAELTLTATPSVLLPYPYHKDQHQRLNAAQLVGAGAAIVCDDAKDPALTARTLQETLIPLMEDPARLEAMRQAAGGLGKPNAASDVAGWMLNHAPQ